MSLYVEIDIKFFNYAVSIGEVVARKLTDYPKNFLKRKRYTKKKRRYECSKQQKKFFCSIPPPRKSERLQKVYRKQNVNGWAMFTKHCPMLRVNVFFVHIVIYKFDYYFFLQTNKNTHINCMSINVIKMCEILSFFRL